MLNEIQGKYLRTIPENAKANIAPWDPKAAKFAKNLIKKIEKDSGLEVFWVGSLALGILGKNDIDLYIFAEPEDFEKHLPKLAQSLGKPTHKLQERILWRIIKDGYKIDASLLSKNSLDVKNDIFFTRSLENNPALLNEYVSLKIPGLSAREYYRLKNEFYNRIVENKYMTPNLG